jgi:hypothetical protein
MALRTSRGFFLLALLFCAAGFLFLGVPAHAQEIVQTTSDVAETAGLGNTNLVTTVGQIISIFLGVLGVIFLILVIYAGVIWMTAGGDPKKIEKAKGILGSAVIGLIIVLLAYAITTFVINLLSNATGTGSNNGGNGSVSVERLSGSLGNGAIRDHYPRRNETDVVRNTKIMVTFKDAMNIPSFITGYDTKGTPTDRTDDVTATALNSENVKIYATSAGRTAALTAVKVAFTDDLKTFSFDPDELLGSSTEDVQYTVALSANILDISGEKIFSGSTSGGYEWSFETGTITDLTPPSVVSVTPSASGAYDRNIVTQVTFDEAVDPTVSTGTRTTTSGFDSITVAGSGGSPLAGEYRISNGYKTVTFIPADPCGTNSCGETLFCLPGSQTMNVTVNAATLGDAAPEARTPYDGIVDMAGNSLDGNNDGTAGDDYAWSFGTTGDISLAGPQILTISPNISEENVPLDQAIEVTFNSVLQSSSVSSDSVMLKNKEVGSGESHEQWYAFDTSLLTAGGEEVGSPSDTASQTRITVSHGTFLESVDGKSYAYGLDVTDGVRNEYQNCYVPAEGPDAKGGACAVTASSPYCCNGSPSSSACALF